MGDPHEGKSKGKYHHWSEPESKLLLQLLVEAINQGFRDASGKFNKLTVETRILANLNEQLGSTKTYSHYKNMTKILKARYQSLANFLRCNLGFGWNSETKKFTADAEVWNVYLKAHPGNTHLRDESFEDFEDLRTIYGQNSATGLNVIGLGDTNNAHVNRDEDSEETNGTNFFQTMNDEERIVYEQEHETLFVSSSGKSTGEKLPLRKKARTEAFNSNKVCEELNSMTEISSQIFGMIKNRWEKEAEEREVEDKTNNVWDAIKEIHDLEQDLCYEAMTLVHSLGMKSGFVSMSVADRRGWILRNLRKPTG
ncbi:unnamed protein product [Cochlearia groenlandica]